MSTKCFFIRVVALAALLALATPAQAQYQLTHGNAAETQNTSQWHQVIHLSHGLDGFVRSGQNAIVNFPLATDVEPWKVFSKVLLRFYADTDVHVVRIDLWDGGTLIKSRTGSWTGDTVVGILPPAGYAIQHGLSLSITATGGYDSNLVKRRFITHGAGVLMEFLPVAVSPWS
jgi:hypothetical protein